MEVPRFIQWIYGEGGPPAEVDSERLKAWAEAFEAWLESSSSEAVWNTRLYTWKSYLKHLGKPPWQAATADVDAWTEAGRQEGKSNDWLLLRLYNLSAFYETCPYEQDPLRVAAHNPVREATKPKVLWYRGINYMSPAETGALLRVIQEDESLPGKRDYALFTLLLLSGRTVKVTKRLKWKDLEIGEDDIARIRWPDKPQHAPQEMPLLAWAALLTFLKASGRLDAMQPDWSLFPPLRRGSSFLPAGDDPNLWTNTGIVRADRLNIILRQYARWAGLKANEIRYKTLRNTAIQRMDAMGLSLEEMNRRLGWNNRYLIIHLRALRRCKKTELWDPAGPEPHEPRLGEGKWWLHQGVVPPLKHGVFAKSLPDAWLEELFDDLPDLAEIDFEQEPLMWEAALARMRSIRLVQMSEEATSLKEMVRLGEMLGKQAGRMTRAVNEWNEQQRERSREGPEAEE